MAVANILQNALNNLLDVEVQCFAEGLGIEDWDLDDRELLIQNIIQEFNSQLTMQDVPNIVKESVVKVRGTTVGKCTSSDDDTNSSDESNVKDVKDVKVKVKKEMEKPAKKSVKKVDKEKKVEKEKPVKKVENAKPNTKKVVIEEIEEEDDDETVDDETVEDETNTVDKNAWYTKSELDLLDKDELQALVKKYNIQLKGGPKNTFVRMILDVPYLEYFNSNIEKITEERPDFGKKELDKFLREEFDALSNGSKLAWTPTK